MSIIAGQQDFAPIDTWDSDFVVSNNQVVLAGTVFTGPIVNCNSWAGTGYLVQINQAASVIGNWYADSAGAVQLAQRVMNLDGLNANLPSTTFWPNLGPWVGFQIVSAIANPTYTLFQWLTQRLVYPPQVQITNFLDPLGTVSIAAGATNTSYGNYVYSGTIGYRWSTAGQPGTLTIGATNGALGGYATIHVETLAANSSADGILEVPEAGLRFQVQNTGAATVNYSLQVWPVPAGGR